MAVLAFSCGGGAYKKAEDAQDAGRQFIRASLDGDFQKARFYLLKDDDNLYVLQRMETDYNKLDAEGKRNYRDASIRPVNIVPVNDSVTRYSYWHTSNAKDTVTLKIIRKNGEWLVDAKSFMEK